MAHYAELNEENIVVNVVVVGNDITHDENGVEQEQLGIDYLNDLLPDSGTWIQTSYNHNTRTNYAAIGFRYNAELDRFEMTEPPPLYPSWTFDDETGTYTEPLPRAGKAWWWDEETVSWIRGAEPPWHKGWDDDTGWDCGTPDMETMPDIIEEGEHYWDGDQEKWILKD